MNNDIVIREKVNEQLTKFSESLSKGLNKPKRGFIHQILFGIQASKDIKLSEIARSLQERIKLIKIEIRLHRHMQDKELGLHLNKMILEQSSKRIDNDTVLAVDITHIHKPYAQKMDFLTRVGDGILSTDR
ncbi:MAG TPA: hypothetical protein ENG49_02730 [Candidatus Omnitrophica bacterium]|nr:hypothetical protein [Candidatus Omnitrophota bacterium]